ncbi:hypothetical protein Hypma_011585 [Hypsizygus marmoreus]|uniref:Uncharacterized protein n=1 Tax=Hypsizygus marmoreus TaxID=39966 RepID=A0A369JIC4_HYPMA|nr:hypothetical protein Hypma_011585 [Hypsizygus marmoreus]
MDDSLDSPLSPTSPTSSSASDSDAFNTADARIHFGPLRSPEKKFVPALAARSSTLHPVSLRSPLRRSPRLSRSPVPESLQETVAGSNAMMDSFEGEEAPEDVPPSGSRTPENEQAFQDEPSSALAIRIIRAHDNPSPPPSPGPNVELESPPSASPRPNSPAFNAMDASSHNAPQTEDAGVEEELCVPRRVDSQSREPSPAPPPTPRPYTIQHDLISFESFSTPAAVFRCVSPRASTSSLPLPSENPSVDDLLSRSPSTSNTPELGNLGAGSPTTPSFPNPIIEHDRKGKGKAIDDAASEMINEQAVVRTVSVPDSERARASSPLVTLSPRHSETTTVSQDNPQTPVRRSTRPRRSGTPYRPLFAPGDGVATNVAATLQTSTFGDGTEEGEQNSDIEGNKNEAADVDFAEGDRRIVGGRRKSGLTRIFQGSVTPKQNQRELGSLSPTSTNLLTQLLPSPAKEPQPPALITLSIPEESSTNPEQKSPSRRTFPELPGPSLPQTPQRTTSPVRFLSPIRPRTPYSPSKARIQLMALDDPHRTPARRIPIEDALAQGHMSSLKAARLLPNSNKMGAQASRTPVLTIPPTDSPARRINISEIPEPSGQKKWQGIRFGSPSRAVSKERYHSAEPQPLGPSSAIRVERMDQRSGLADSSFLNPPGVASSSTLKPRKLPFPIVAPRLDPSMQGESERKPSNDNTSSPAKPRPTPTSSPLKSTLKQTTSRIPRTIKPYARPPTKVSESRPTGSMRTVDLSTDSVKSATAVKEPGLEVTASSSDDVKSEAKQVPARPGPVTLKRKRGPEGTSPLNKPRPVVLLRQVPRAGQASTTSTSKTVSGRSITILAKKAPQQIRRVVDRPVEPQPSQAAEQGDDAQSLPGQDVAGEPDETETPNLSEAVAIEKTPPSSANPPGSPAQQADGLTDGIRRRTTRVRKTINPTIVADVFNGTDVRTLPPRRRAAGQSSARPGTVFSGMSAVALKALTSSNTARNQKYLAAKLETEVIRKDGTRPESPTVKIRTISQRHQDEKSKQRKERAERRARRSGSGSPADQNEIEGRSDAGDSSDVDSGSDLDSQHSSPIRRRHKRGPGDEDDYETPIKEPRLKRLKLGEDVGGSRENERRVKWDRGLFTTIYLDEVKLGTRRPPKDNIATKGCLAPTAKALPLDNLGNLPHADSPLADLVEENVVVKKYVYDNDVEPAKEVIAVKNTRLRSRKGKS